MINELKLEEIKLNTIFDDKPFKIDLFSSQPDQFCSIMQLAECFSDCEYYDCHISNIAEWGDTIGTMKLNWGNSYYRKKEAVKEAGLDAVFHYDTKPRLKMQEPSEPITWFAKQNPIHVFNFEYHNPNCALMINALLDTFYLDVDSFGTWPAMKSRNSGCAHATYAKEDTYSMHPTGKTYNSFILQTSGVSTFTVFKERRSGLSDRDIPLEWPKDKRISFFNSMEVYEEYVLQPGDLLYIPDRQYYYEHSKVERTFVNFPLILKGPHSSYEVI